MKRRIKKKYGKADTKVMYGYNYPVGKLSAEEVSYHMEYILTAPHHHTPKVIFKDGLVTPDTLKKSLYRLGFMQTSRWMNTTTFFIIQLVGMEPPYKDWKLTIKINAVTFDFELLNGHLREEVPRDAKYQDKRDKDAKMS